MQSASLAVGLKVALAFTEERPGPVRQHSHTQCVFSMLQVVCLHKLYCDCRGLETLLASMGSARLPCRKPTKHQTLTSTRLVSHGQAQRHKRLGFSSQIDCMSSPGPAVRADSTIVGQLLSQGCSRNCVFP